MVKGGTVNMGANKTPIDKKMTREKAISQGGYYNTDGDWNCIVTLDEYPGKILRGRVEVLILKDGKLFMFLKENGRYRIPGGGFDRGVLNKDQAFIETKEEAKLIISNIRYTGVTYTHIFKDIWYNSKDEIPYDGTYNEVYVADYKGDYEGYIRKGLSDMELTNKGKFYDLEEVESILKPEHRQALNNTFNHVITEGAVGDDLVSVAQELQNKLRMIRKDGCFQHFHIRDIESDDGGYVFAEYYNEVRRQEIDTKYFIDYCNSVIKKSVYN